VAASGKSNCVVNSYSTCAGQRIFLAIVLLQEIIQKHPSDATLLSSLARIHLQMGNVRSATAIFKLVDGLFPEPESCPIVHMNRGFLALSLNQFTTAIDHFQEVIDITSTDPQHHHESLVAANNKAICLLYTCDLTQAISLLEDLIHQDPERNLNETVVFNLCTLYDLKSDSSIEKKKALMTLIGKHGSETFDMSNLKLSTL